MKKIISVLFLIVIVSLSISFVVAQTANDSSQTSDKKLKVIKKPIPKTEGKCSQWSGLAVIKVVFDKSGIINEVEMIKSSDCAVFDRNSLDAARRIKFEPKVKDGEPVTVTKHVEYKFDKY